MSNSHKLQKEIASTFEVFDEQCAVKVPLN